MKKKDLTKFEDSELYMHVSGLEGFYDMSRNEILTLISDKYLYTEKQLEVLLTTLDDEDQR